jgi:hypothetical protein
VVAGFGVAEAMDTAQRGMGLDWPTSLELIRARREARGTPGAVVFAAPAPTTAADRDAPIDASSRRTRAMRGDRGGGGRIILMASRALARARARRRLRDGVRRVLRRCASR